MIWILVQDLAMVEDNPDFKDYLEPSMTVDKFRQASEHYQRRCLIGIGWAIMGALAAGLVSMGLAKLLSDSGGLSEPVREIVVGLSPFPGVLVFFGILWSWERRSLADSQLRCPHCVKDVVSLKHLVIATRNCPHCGLKILEEPNAPELRPADLES